jgi:outer membrane protein, multidrug efflux system
MKKLLVPCLAAALLVGCAVGPDYKQPTLVVPEKYREVEGPPTPGESLADLQWWESFGDPTLKGLIDEALLHGYDVRIAASRVDESRARAGIAKSQFFPQIGYGGDVSRRLISTEVVPGSTTNNLVSANVNFGWELDLWGRIRRLNESAKAQYLATEEARRGVVLSLVSEVATTYFTLRALDEQLEISKSTVGSFEEQYKLYDLKLKGGAASSIQTTYASAAVGQVASAVPEIERQIEATENRLCLLLGRNPGPIPRGGVLWAQAPPPKIPAGLPSDLLKRRPDILQAEQQLIAANADVGVATANFFPSISLTGLFGGISADVSNLFGTGKTWSIAAGLVGPLFQGGRLRAEYEVSVARWEQAKAQYEQTVTGAFAETTTVLYAREKIAASMFQLRRTVRDYQEMVRLANIRYDAGVSDYFEVLYAMQLLYPAQLRLVTAQLDLAADYVNIYKALGGGWSQPETPPAAPPPESAPVPAPASK